MSGFLVDENLSPRLAAALTAAGHDARHVNEVGLQGEPDQAIMAWAAKGGRTVITADHDFHEHLFARGAAAPSVVRLSQRGPQALAGTEAQAERLASLLPGLEPYLAGGIAVTVDSGRLSVVPLPLAQRLQRLPTEAELDRVTRPGPARMRPGREQPGREGPGRAASPARPEAGRVLERVREHRLRPADRGLGR